MKKEEELKIKEKEITAKGETINIKEDELNKKEKNIKEKGKTVNISEEELKIKENDINKRQGELNKKEDELKKIMDIIKKREEEINRNKNKVLEMENNYNQKISLFENKERMLEENIKKNKNINQENNYLIIKIKELEKENQELKLNAKSNINNNKPIKLFKTPTLIGLNNIGATCFMNSTLQCLSQTKKLTNYFLKQYYKDTINKNDIQLCSVYNELINNLWKKNGEQSFSPNNFMNTINEMNPLFKLGQAGDSKDFIIFILEQLHKELKKPTNINNNGLVTNDNLNQYDKDNAFIHFFTDFQSSCSIISDIFFGMTETTNVCLNCKNNYNSRNLNYPICYNYQIFNCLIFPLEEVKNMKYNSMINSNNCNNINNNYNYNNNI